MTFQKTLMLTTAALALVTGVGSAYAETTLTIESWRSDDLPIWQDTILPAFMKEHPDIKVVFSPTDATQYNAALNTKLQGGSAGDIITCRPFDASLALFKAGQLADLTTLPGM
jgi:raffinose/stachyose/melibiose transport system substrate-binding protein